MILRFSCRGSQEYLEYLKSSNKYFIIFEDRAGKIRVLYKRSDGRFGLY